MDDLISRQAAIRWVKTECNPYGKPTLEFESGKKVIEHLGQLPSAQPEIVRCKDCKHYKTEFCAIDLWTDEVKIYKARPDDFCSRAERRRDALN